MAAMDLPEKAEEGQRRVTAVVNDQFIEPLMAFEDWRGLGLYRPRDMRLRPCLTQPSEQGQGADHVTDRAEQNDQDTARRGGLRRFGGGGHRVVRAGRGATVARWRRSAASRRVDGLPVEGYGARKFSTSANPNRARPSARRRLGRRLKCRYKPGPRRSRTSQVGVIPPPMDKGIPLRRRRPGTKSR